MCIEKNRQERFVKYFFSKGPSISIVSPCLPMRKVTCVTNIIHRDRYNVYGLHIINMRNVLCVRNLFNVTCIHIHNRYSYVIAYLIPLEFLYRLFEQLGILYSNGAERQVPLEYLDKNTCTRV